MKLNTDNQTYLENVAMFNFITLPRAAVLLNQRLDGKQFYKTIYATVTYHQLNELIALP